MLGKEKWILVLFEKVFCGKCLEWYQLKEKWERWGVFVVRGFLHGTVFSAQAMWPQLRTWPPQGFSYSFSISCNLAIFRNLQAMITA